MKEYTDKELLSKAEAYCSTTERCPSEVLSKLRQWGSTEQLSSAIIAHLLKEQFLNEKRYCTAFVRDKYRFNQWGRIKIAQALRMKQLPEEAIDAGLQDIDEEEYTNGLQKLLRQKGKSIKAANAYEHNTKLIRFAIGKGFSMNEVLKYVKQIETDGIVD